MLLVPVIAALAGFGWACCGIFIAAKVKSIESFSYWQSGLLTPMFLVAPGRSSRLAGCRPGRRCWATSTPLIHCVQLVRHAVSAFAGVADIGHLAYLVVFGRGLARLAIRFMQRRLIL
jgi:lipooligosaccharide transport system permease protein